MLSVALLLRHLGYEAEAARVETTVAAVLAARDLHTPYPTTDGIGDALANQVRSVPG